MKKKPLGSLLTLIVIISALSIFLQCISSISIGSKALKQFEDAMKETKLAQVAAYADMFSNSIDTLSMHGNTLLLGAPMRRLALKIGIYPYNSQYILDAQYLWESLNTQRGLFPFARNISVYVVTADAKVTQESIKKYGTAEKEWLQQVLHTSENNMACINNTLYFWQASRYTNSKQLSDLPLVWLVRCDERSIRQQLAKYQTQDSNTSYGAYWVEENEMICLASNEDFDSGAALHVLRENKNAKSGSSVQYIEGLPCLVTWSQVENTNILLVQTMLWDTLTGPLAEHRKNLLFSSAIVLVISLGFMMILYGMINHPLRKLRQALRAIEDGKLNVRMKHSNMVEFQEVYNQFNRMANQIQNLVEKEYELRLLNTQAELKWMQYQINPHFLYNSYFTLCSLLNAEEYEQCQRFSELLGKFLRYITVSKQDMVSLEDEWEHARAYAMIQSVRFGDRIKVEMEPCPAELQAKMVPRMVLQPLLENAFEHGVKQKVGNGLIRVRIVTSPELMIVVEDNGDTVDENALEAMKKKMTDANAQVSRSGVALINIHKRLRLLYPSNFGLQLERSELGGLRVSVGLSGEMEKLGDEKVNPTNGEQEGQGNV